MWDKLKNLFKNEEKSKVINNLEIKDNIKLNKKLKKNINLIKANIADCDDLNYRKFNFAKNPSQQAVAIFLNEFIEKDDLHQYVLKPLMEEDSINNIKSKDLLKEIKNNLLAISEIKLENDLANIITAILNGETALLINGVKQALILDIKQTAGRGVETPNIEATTRGPQEGFVENISTNITLIRKRLKDNNLMLKMKKIGVRSNTDVAMLYINDIAKPEIVKEVETRVDNINTDVIYDTGTIAQHILDNPHSPFPQFKNTERPDKTVASLMEGRVVLLVDGTPFALILPIVFIQFLNSPEDYYDHYFIGSALRILRLLSLIMAISLPAVYISLTSFRHELIPIDLALTIARVRAGVPFPAFLEALIMEVSLELLRESGIRLPGAIGQTIGIVGGLILGEAAVQAGLVSPPMVIVVAITAIASFAIPSYEAAVPLRLIRFPVMIAASIFGVLGLMFSWLVILIHLCSLKSIKQPYFAPFAPLKWHDLKDSLIRMPLNWLKSRPESIPTQNKKRQKTDSEAEDNE